MSDGVIVLDDIHPTSADYRLDLARLDSRRAIQAAVKRASCNED